MAVCMNQMQKLKELIKLSSLCNFQLFATNIEGNMSHQKLRNCWVAKRLISHNSIVKFRLFRREFLRNHSVYWAQISEITKTVMPFQYSEFIFYRHRK